MWYDIFVAVNCDILPMCILYMLVCLWGRAHSCVTVRERKSKRSEKLFHYAPCPPHRAFYKTAKHSIPVLNKSQSFAIFVAHLATTHHILNRKFQLGFVMRSILLFSFSLPSSLTTSFPLILGFRIFSNKCDKNTRNWTNQDHSNRDTTEANCCRFIYIIYLDFHEID